MSKVPAAAPEEIDVAERPEFGGRLTQEMLDRAKITEIGGAILGGKGTLQRLGSLEGKEFAVSIADGIVVPNPEQPRKYFDPKKMEELKGSIQGDTQQVAIVAVPFVQNGLRKLFIIDGERRARALKELGVSHARVAIRWARNEEEIFLKSLILNESKADHNLIERARAYRRLIDYEKRKGTPAPMQVIAKRLGLSDQTIYNHLRLLNLPESVQMMIIEGKMPTYGALQLSHAKTRFGDKFNDVKAAALLLTDMEKATPDRSDISDTQAITRANVDNAIRATLLEGGHVEASQDLVAQKAGMDLITGLNRMKAGMKAVEEADKEAFIRALRTKARGQPSELVRDGIDEVIDRLSKVRILVERAINPDPLPEIPGKPTFVSFIKLKQQRTSVFAGSPLRAKMALLLAESSDDKGKVLRVPAMAEKLGATVEEIGSNFRHLEMELGSIGLRLEQHIEREKTGKQVKYYQRPTYRISWTREDKSSAATATPAIQPIPVETPAAAPDFSPAKKAEPVVLTSKPASVKVAASPAISKSQLAPAIPAAAPTMAEPKVPKPASGLEIPSEPTFADRVQANNTAFHNNPLHAQIAVVLACAADRGEALPTSVIATKLRAEEVTIGCNMAQLERELGGIGLRLGHTFEGRIPFYRLSLATETGPAAAAPTKVPPSSPAPKPVAASKPADLSFAAPSAKPDATHRGIKVEAPPELGASARTVADYIAQHLGNAGINRRTPFGNSLGVKIEVRRPPDPDAPMSFFVHCNALGFTRNMRDFAPVFAEMLAGKRPDRRIEVYIRDLDDVR